MPETLPGNYELAAQIMYAAGRKARRDGEPRDVTSSPSNPRNPLRWDQGWLTNTFLQNFGDPPLGQVANHYFYGWDDENVGWPDRGWRYGVIAAGKVPANKGPGINGASRNFWLYWLYTLGWSYATKPSQFVLGEPRPGDMDKFLSRAEQQWELDKGRSDRLAGATPPLVAFVDPAPFGVPGLGQAGSGQAGGATKPGEVTLYQGGGLGGFGGGGLLSTFIPLFLLKSLTNSSRKRRSQQ